MGDNLSHAQLALDPAGHPRILLTLWPPDSVFQYLYGECDAACANSASWKLTTVATGVSYTFPPGAENNQSFALDAQGHPRFVYYAKESYYVNGSVFYTYCDSSCTDAANWGTTKLSDAEWKNLSLAFTPTGLARLVFTFSSGDPDYETRVAYVECDTADCANWSGITLLTAAIYSPGGGLTFALRTDTNGNPRLAYYPGTGSGGSLETDQSTIYPVTRTAPSPARRHHGRSRSWDSPITPTRSRSTAARMVSTWRSIGRTGRRSPTA